MRFYRMDYDRPTENKEALRQKLMHDVKTYLDNGGKITELDWGETVLTPNLNKAIANKIRTTEQR